MYEAVHISNFRGLNDFVGERLGRLNLFVGPNNVGKTSLLEALWLLQYPAYPAATLTLALIRGLNPLQQNPDPEPLWHPLFSDLDVANSINILGLKHDGTRELLEISLTRGWVGTLESGSNGGTSAPSLNALGGGVTAPPEWSCPGLMDRGC